jgi:hypothetical protein
MNPVLSPLSDHFALSSTTGDFNRDGKLDLAIGSNDHVDTLLGKGDGALQPPQRYYFAAGVFSIAAADFNGDGILDLVFAGTLPDLVVMPGNADGTFGHGPSASITISTGMLHIYPGFT